MKNRAYTTSIFIALSLFIGGCGGDDAEQEEEAAGGGDSPAEFIPTRIEDSVFIHIEELRKKKPEFATDLYGRAEEILTPESFLEAAKIGTSERTQKLLEVWENEPLHIVGNQFGQVRYIIAFAGSSTGNADEDYVISRELQTAFAGHARKVITNLITEMESQPDPGKPADIEPESPDKTPPPDPPTTPDIE